MTDPIICNLEKMSTFVPAERQEAIDLIKKVLESYHHGRFNYKHFRYFTVYRKIFMTDPETQELVSYDEIIGYESVYDSNEISITIEKDVFQREILGYSKTIKVFIDRKVDCHFKLN